MTKAHRERYSGSVILGPGMLFTMGFYQKNRESVTDSLQYVLTYDYLSAIAA